jgi:hypothetical protein
MYAQTMAVAGPSLNFSGAAPRRPVDYAAITLMPLRGQAAIDSVLYLREEIDLSVHTKAGAQQFAILEKKETSAVSSAVSNSVVSGSARSASCRWVTS